MDVISGVSAVVNVLDVLAGFGLQAQKYIKIMKDAPDTIRNIKSDLEHIDVVLPKLKRELDRPDGGGVLSLSDSEAELNGIVTSLLSLTCEISILLENYKDGISSTKMKAEWALSGKAKAEECGKRLSTLCQALTIVLQFSERTFNRDHANKTEEQQRIMMTQLERLRVQNQPRTAYTESWVASDGGTYASSVFSRPMYAQTTADTLSVVPENDSDDGSLDGSEDGRSLGASTPKRRMSHTGSSSSVLYSEEWRDRERRTRLMEQVRVEVENEMRTVVRRAKMAERGRQIAEQERQEAEALKRRRLLDRTLGFQRLMGDVSEAMRRLEVPANQGSESLAIRVTAPPVFDQKALLEIHHLRRDGDEPMSARYNTSDRKVLDLSAEEELLSMYTGNTLDTMTEASGRGDVKGIEFCADLAENLYQDLCAVRDELEDLEVQNKYVLEDDATTVVDERPFTPVPLLDFPFMVKTYKTEIKKQKEAAEKEEADRKRKEVEEQQAAEKASEEADLKWHEGLSTNQLIETIMGQAANVAHVSAMVKPGVEESLDEKHEAQST